MDSTEAAAVAETINEAVAASDVPPRSEVSALRAEMRSDMVELRAEMRADMATLRADVATLHAEMRADMAALETRLTWRMFLVVGSLLALATALERLLG